MNPPKASADDPIDAVYAWAAGSDPLGELRFSLRSLERNAPWIRKIHLVTDGEAPDWIDRGHARLSLVRHEDIFRDRGVLPTSNLRAIEWQFFRIPGISRQFLYCDADFFLGRRVTPADFRTPKGGCRFFAEPADLPPGSAAESLLNRRFGDRSPRKKPAHTPKLLDRTFLEEVNRIWEGQIKRTVARRSPDPEDVSMEVLYFYYLLECPQQFGAHEQAVPAAKTYRLAALSSPADAWKQLAAIAVARPKFFCLKDATAGDSPRVGKIMRTFLSLYYWRRSPFEK